MITISITGIMIQRFKTFLHCILLSNCSYFEPDESITYRLIFYAILSQIIFNYSKSNSKNDSKTNIYISFYLECMRK